MIVQRVRELLLEQLDLVAVIGNRIYPMTWPDAPEFPLIVLQKITGLGETDMQGEAGIESDRVQADVYTDGGYEELTAIKGIVRRTLHGFKGGPATAPCVIDYSACINDADQPVPDAERAGPRLRRRMLEFRIWNREV